MLQLVSVMEYNIRSSIVCGLECALELSENMTPSLYSKRLLGCMTVVTDLIEPVKICRRRGAIYIFYLAVGRLTDYITPTRVQRACIKIT